MNYFVFLKEQQERKKLKKQAQVQENTEITFMSAWFVMGVFLVSFFPAVPLELRNSSLHYEAVSPLGLHRLYYNNI